MWRPSKANRIVALPSIIIDCCCPIRVALLAIFSVSLICAQQPHLDRTTNDRMLVLNSAANDQHNLGLFPINGHSSFEQLSSIVGQQQSPPNTLSARNIHETIGQPSTAIDMSEKTASSVSNKTNGRRRPELFELPSAREQRVPVVRSQIRLKLKHYFNRGRRMRNLTTCACPTQDESNCSKDGNHSPCYFSFTAVVGSADQIVDFRSTPFVVVDGRTEAIDANKEPEWGAEMLFELPAKPHFVDIFAFNLGPVFGLDGKIVSWAETLWPVDAWTVDLETSLPASGLEPTEAAKREELTGRYDTLSTLELEWSAQCMDHFMGIKCDLICNQPIQRQSERFSSKKNNQKSENGLTSARNWKTICQSALDEGHSFECDSMEKGYQVWNCKFCKYGVNGDLCVQDPAFWKSEPDNLQLYKTLAIVFGILTALLLLLLLLTCIFFFIFCRGRRSSRVRRDSPATNGSTTTYRRGFGAPYNVSENGFGGTNRSDSKCPHPLPVAVQRSILQQQQQQQQEPTHPRLRQPTMGASQSPSTGAAWETARGAPANSSSPDTSESEYRASPFTPRREAQV